MNQILEQLGIYGIVPVVVLQDAAKACLLYTSDAADE